jgi:glutaredoxin-like YruB-family protein
MDASTDTLPTTSSTAPVAPEVIIYSTPSCHFCAMAKAFLEAHEIAYTNYDVSVDQEKRAEMIQKSGQMGVPVITINGTMVIGYNKPKIMDLLGVSD